MAVQFPSTEWQQIYSNGEREWLLPNQEKTGHKNFSPGALAKEKKGRGLDEQMP